jgi:acetylornithine aminotransferase
LAKGVAAETFTPGKHGSTFGGGPLACTAALTTLAVMESDGLLDHAANLGAFIRADLAERLKGQAGIIEIRGQGLMIGIELDRACGDLVRMGLEDKLLINVTNDTVVRLLPPLVMQMSEAALLTEKLASLIRKFLG